MATSSNFAANGYISGMDSALELHDASGKKYTIVASTAKNNVAIVAGSATTAIGDIKVAEKAANYTVKASESGTLFVATAAVTFTLPAIADVWDGWNAKFYQVADANLVVAAPADKMVAPADAAATSVTFSTTDEKIGATCTITYVATTAKYLLELHGDKHTATIA